jgi:hypothetical protein
MPSIGASQSPSSCLNPPSIRAVTATARPSASLLSSKPEASTVVYRYRDPASTNSGPRFAYTGGVATIATEGTELVVRLSMLERLGALKPFEPRVPLAAVKSVWVADNPWRELRGIRAPGTGFPGIIMLGTTRGRGGRDFACVYVRRPAVVVELEDAFYDRLLVCPRDAVAVADRIAQATATAVPEPAPSSS